jgi:hypothetical protein
MSIEKTKEDLLNEVNDNTEVGGSVFEDENFVQEYGAPPITIEELERISE